MKTSNVKKVLSIVILCVIVAVTVATVVLAVVPKTLYNPIDDGYSAITVYKNTKSNTYKSIAGNSEQDQKVVGNIEEKLALSVKDNILSTIFQGTGSFESTVVYEKTATDCMSSVAKKSNGVCLIFNYLDEQTLVIDGEEYTHPDATGEGKTIVYTKMFMPVSNNEEFQECTVYLAGSNNKSNFKIKFLAHQSELFDYLSDLDWEVA